jgi:transposase InsO family protein
MLIFAMALSSPGHRVGQDGLEHAKLLRAGCDSGSGGFTADLTAAVYFRHGLRRSMGATGICWDNSPAESFWSTFKHEEYYRHVYATKTDLVAAVDNWIGFYDSVRRHSEKSLQASAP